MVGNSRVRYPEINDSEYKVLWLNSGSSYEKSVKARNDICVIKHGLYIPKSANSYEEFVETISQSEENFITIFAKKYYETANG